MKSVTALLVALLVVGLVSCGYMYYRPQSKESVEITPVIQQNVESESVSAVPVTGAPAQIARFTNDEHDFAFKYRIKPYGYSMFENTAEENEELDTLFGVTLMRSDDYNEVERARANNEPFDGGQTMSVLVYDAAGVSDVAAWLIEQKLVTNCEEGSVLNTVVAEQDAVSCLWDGLYAGVSVAVLHNNKIYLMLGTRDEGENEYGYTHKQDFDDLVTTFGFEE